MRRRGEALAFAFPLFFNLSTYEYTAGAGHALWVPFPGMRRISIAPAHIHLFMCRIANFPTLIFRISLIIAYSVFEFSLYFKIRFAIVWLHIFKGILSMLVLCKLDAMNTYT